MPRPKSGYFNAAGQPIPGTHRHYGPLQRNGGLMNGPIPKAEGCAALQRDALDIGTAVHRMAELDLRGIPGTRNRARTL